MIAFHRLSPHVIEIKEGNELVGAVIYRECWQFHADEQIFSANDLAKIVKKIRQLTNLDKPKRYRK